MLKIGGSTGDSNTGIHGRHLDTGSRITYLAGDAQRQTIAQVTYRDDKGQLVEYSSADVKPAPASGTPSRARWTAWTATTGPPTPSRCPTGPSTGHQRRPHQPRPALRQEAGAWRS